ncbi:anaerobic sulfatase maturase [Maridesulfovibrio salexigens]|uniref:Radical SAM domain protein n=1 Tax=Maridesulfovibrio salexigens (strain ATCC 14822 / DSM 2638 / NCIMB 8403 / VKM B-1763) TaxID=526222 RepID=C6BRH3_MARSD|nr:anaerobic sulfatase maturase [Maridesulfovibrio salexigens]ACS79413.1 Radical SAM domain protein [Maridesulfovibrio salexigens DSM 2638]
MMQKPLQTILIKPAGPDCNMACTYCFYLNKKELFESTSIHRMPDELLKELIRQAMEQSAEQVSFIWQGGEPTLMGLDFYRKTVELQQQFGRGQMVGNGLQTNGLLINDDWIHFLKAYNWLVGLSLDGPEHIHDHYRRNSNGKGTWQKVVANAERMLANDLAVNALVVVNDYSVSYPDDIYQFHKNLGLPHMQFIPCVEVDIANPSQPSSFSVPAEKYGQFLCRIFDLWMNDFSGLTPTTSVRMFDSLFHLYMGQAAPECTLLNECGNYVVVEHNGDVFSCDFFVQPEWRLGNIKSSSLTEMLNSGKQRAFGLRKASQCDECKNCRWLTFCRGGCPKDRIMGHGNNKQTYLCPAYKIFFEHSDKKFRQLAREWEKQYSVMRTQRRNTEFSSNDKPGRNTSCPCGSGKKFKRCCGA